MEAPNLKPLFRERRIRAGDVATLTGRSNAAVSDWVNGVRFIPAEQAVKVAAFTGIPRHILRPDLWDEGIGGAPAGAV
jgi:DNA-binding transcriptional regulator YdaS (Cro superfamily)